MTYSILAFDPQTDSLGCAAATGNLAVGAWVLRAEANVGVVATQGRSVSSLWGDQAMHQLANGRDAARILDDLVGADSGAHHRQLTIIDRHGNASGWTGTENVDFKAHWIEDGLVVAGNWLANESVLSALLAGYRNREGPMPDRLLAALQHASNSGGDLRGTQSAALKVVSPSAPPIDLRVDFSDSPVGSLVSLYERTQDNSYRQFLERLPTVNSPHHS